MSWFFKSLQSSSSDDGSGVKDDLAAFSETVGCQLRGVADFFAPPPDTAAKAAEEEPSSSSSQAIHGIRNDLAEIGDSFKSSLSRISGTKAVTEISKFASSFLQFPREGTEELEGDSGDDTDGVVAGINYETIDLVRKISDRPELWTEFPLSVDNDFHMSDAQKEHALAIENLVPSFSVLRVKLENYISSKQFWMIYFILLVPRLNEQDCELLSSSKIIEARDVLLQKLQSKENVQSEISEDPHTLDASQERTDVKPAREDDIPSAGKEDISKRQVTAARIDVDAEEATDMQLNKTHNDACSSLSTHKKVENEEDFSFSDLEEEDSNLSRKISGLKLTKGSGASSPGESNEWVRLNPGSGVVSGHQKAGQSFTREKDSEGEDSNEWLNVDYFE